MKIKHLPHSICNVSYKFGYSQNYFNGKELHTGVDIKSAVYKVTGDNIYAVDNGKIVISKNNPGGYGNYVVIDHEDYCSLYAHLLKVEIPVNSIVKAGDIIGHLGNSGNSTGPHLHFELRKGKYDSKFFTKNKDGMWCNAIDPEPILEEFKNRDIINSNNKDDYLNHWAYPIWEKIKNKGININEHRFNDSITRGEAFALISQVLDYIDKK